MAETNALSIKKRAISDDFLKKFIDTNGIYKNLINLIDKNGIYKSRFMLNLRGTSVQIYYKCKHVLTIFEKKDSQHKDKNKKDSQHKDKNNKDSQHKDKNKFECTIKYIHNKKENKKWDKTFFDLDKLPLHEEKGDKYAFYLSDNEVRDFDWKTLFNALCDGIDFCFTYKNEAEKEVQQRIWFENNIARSANSTEYVIVDTEYAVSHGGRFDFWAFYWPDHSARHPSELVCIELKYGQTAVNDKNSGDKAQEDKKQSSLKGHLIDFRNFNDFLKTNDDDINISKGGPNTNKDDQNTKQDKLKKSFYEDISKVFGQLYKMGMIDMSLEKWVKTSINKNKYPILIDKTTKKQMMFMLANYKPKASVLENQILALIAEQMGVDENKKMVEQYVKISNKTSKSNTDIETLDLLTKNIIKMIEQYFSDDEINDEEVSFANSSYCGYGLYKQNTSSLKDIINDLKIVDKLKEYIKKVKHA